MAERVTNNKEKFAQGEEIKDIAGFFEELKKLQETPWDEWPYELVRVTFTIDDGGLYPQLRQTLKAADVPGTLHRSIQVSGSRYYYGHRSDKRRFAKLPDVIGPGTPIDILKLPAGHSAYIGLFDGTDKPGFEDRIPLNLIKRIHVVRKKNNP